MKKLIILLALLFQIGGICFAQIFANKSTNGSITITSIGITDRPYSLSSTNTGLGENAIPNANTVTNNTAIGSQALQIVGINFPNAYNGNNNTAIGYTALFNNLQGFDNTAFGAFAMQASNGTIIGSSNTAFGKDALKENTLGSNNAALGLGALSFNSTGNNNAAYGEYALSINQTSHNNVSFGAQSLRFHTTNDNNTAFGVSALYNDQSGTNNTTFGYLSLQNNISGSTNTAFGTTLMSGMITGNSNVAFGHHSMTVNDAQNNIGAGFYAFDKNTTGSRNVVLGVFALRTNVSGSGNVAIGSQAGYNETGSDKLYIDANFNTFNATVTLIGGDFAANKVCINCDMALTGVNDFSTRTEAFQVTGNAFKTLGSGNWQIPSDRRLKTKVISLNRDEMLAKTLLMQGVNYDLIANPEQGMQYGFIAQDLHKIFPTKVYENKTGYLSSSYGDYVPMFVEAIKALNERIVKLEDRVFDIKAMTARVEEMERVLKK